MLIGDILLLYLFPVYLYIENLGFDCSCLVFRTYPFQDSIK